MYKKHEHIIGFFLKQYFQVYTNLLKNTQNIEKGRIIKSLCPIKKKVKRFKLARTTTTKTTFKSE